MTITYASNPGDVQQAIDTVKRLEGGLFLAIQQQNAYSLEEKVASCQNKYWLCKDNRQKYLLINHLRRDNSGRPSLKRSKDLFASTVRMKDIWLKIVIC